MTQSTQVYITDKTGKRFFNTNCSVAFKEPEIRNLQRHLDQSAKYPAQYKFLDIPTARIVDESAGDIDFNMSDEQLLKELGV